MDIKKLVTKTIKIELDTGLIVHSCKTENDQDMIFVHEDGDVQNSSFLFGNPKNGFIPISMQDLRRFIKGLEIGPYLC